jgi:hypothetical protein
MNVPVMSRARGRLAARVIVLALLLPIVGAAWAQQRTKVPIPEAPLNPTSRAECTAMSRAWQELVSHFGHLHQECLNSRACQGSSRPESRGKCSCAHCEEFHQMNDRLASGDLGQLRREREKACEREVSAHLEREREQRLAAERARREQQRLADESARQAAEAQRQYEDMQRRQREHAQAVTAQQLENQRRTVERLQAQQRQQQALMSSISGALLRDPPSAATAPRGPVPGASARPDSLIGGVIHDASRAIDLAQRVKDDLGTTRDLFQAMFSGDAGVRAEARASLGERARSDASSLAASGAAALITGLMPRRNDHHDPGFAAFYDTVQNNTIGALPSPPGVRFLQESASGVLHDVLQQTLGDMAQLQRDLDSFGAIDGGAPRVRDVGQSSRDEVESLRQALRHALNAHRCVLPSGEAVIEGERACEAGRMLLCRGGRLMAVRGC